VARPDLKRPGEFLPPNTSGTAPQTPGMDVTGPVPPTKPFEPTMPVEDLIKLQAASAPPAAVPGQQLQFVPAVLAPQPGQAPPQAPTPTVAPPPAAAPAK